MSNEVKNLMKTLIIIFFLLTSATVFAECSESFSWLPNTEPNVAKYKIYHGEVDGVYPYVTDVGKPDPIDGRCNGTVDGLECDQKYYFVAVAVNFYGTESLYSDQVILTTNATDDDVPSPPRDFKVVE